MNRLVASKENRKLACLKNRRWNLIDLNKMDSKDYGFINSKIHHLWLIFIQVGLYLQN